MIGRCIMKRRMDVGSENLDHFDRYVHLDEVGLDVGRSYLIYGVVVLDGRPWFFVCEDDGDAYPVPHYAGFFDVVDRRIPPGWMWVENHPNVGPLAMLPREWVARPFFLEALVDGDAVAVSVFREIRNALAVWHEVAK
jgi:hypothetical protein